MYTVHVATDCQHGGSSVTWPPVHYTSIHNTIVCVHRTQVRLFYIEGVHVGSMSSTSWPCLVQCVGHEQAHTCTCVYILTITNESYSSDRCTGTNGVRVHYLIATLLAYIVPCIFAALHFVRVRTFVLVTCLPSIVGILLLSTCQLAV